MYIDKDGISPVFISCQAVFQSLLHEVNPSLVWRELDAELTL